MADVSIRSTITVSSIQLRFGAQSSIDYRSLPGEEGTGSVATIFNNMRKTETPPVLDIKKLHGTVYSPKNRKIITSWLRDVCWTLHLKTTTLCLAIQLTDAYTIENHQTVPLDKCQLVAVTCLWDAAKYEEMDDRLPSLHRLVRICDNVYTADDILDMEEKILNSFKWRLPHTTVVRHLYLQFHLIGSEDLVVRNPAVDKATNDIVSLQLLIENKDEHVWKPFSSRAGCTIKDLIPQLCATVGMAVTASVEVFQVFGANPLVLQRIPQDTSLGSLSMDCLNLTRLFLSNGRVNYAFIERGPFIMPRTINKRFLNQCEVLIQEVVIHVEFLQVHSYVRALGALLLAMCIMATDMAEVVRAIRYVQNKLDISPGKSAAVARMLTTKYREVLKEAQQQHNLPDIPENIIARVDMCAAKKTT